MKNKIFLILACVFLSVFQSNEVMAEQEIIHKEAEAKLVSPEVKKEEISYVAKEGATLKGALNEWSIRNGYRLKWNVRASNGDEIDWKIERAVISNKDFYSAVSELLTAYKNSSLKIKFIWKFYKSNRVLVIGLGDTK